MTSTAGGGCVGVLPVGDAGRKDSSMPLVHAHSGWTEFVLLGICKREGITVSQLLVVDLQGGRTVQK